MFTQINIVLGETQKTKEIGYQDNNGIVWLSSEKDSSMQNVITEDNADNPNPQDSIWMLEPITVRANDYKISHLIKYKKIFGCFSRAFENTIASKKFVTVNYGSDFCWNVYNSSFKIDNADIIKSQWTPWEERKNGVVIFAGWKNSHHYSSIYHLREEIADTFIQNGFEVSWYGNVPQHKKSYFKPYVLDKLSEINKYKFHVCTENTYDPIYSYNYLTEKLPQGICGGAVPLYIGCYNIDQIAPKNSFFDLREFISSDKYLNKNKFIEKIKTYSKSDFEIYQNTAYNWLKDPKGLTYHMSIKRIYQKMLEILSE